MKKINFNFRLLVLIGVLIMSVPQMWGGTKRVYCEYSGVSSWWGTVYIYAWGGGKDAKKYTAEATGTANLVRCDIDDYHTNLLFYRADSQGGDWIQQSVDVSIGSNNRWSLGDGGWGNKGTISNEQRYAPGTAIDGLRDIKNPHNQMFTNGKCSVELAAHQTYEFKILETSTLYGLNDLIATSSISNQTLNTSGYQVRLCTASAGTYIFAYNTSNHQLSITYPTVTKHPSIDYCYVINYSWSPSSNLYLWNGTSTKVAEWDASSTIAGSSWPGPVISNNTTINSTSYFYIAPGEFEYFMVSKNGDSSDRTGEVEPNYGKYRWHNGTSWVWDNFIFRITLDEQAVCVSAPSDPDVEFFGTALSNSAGAVTIPVRTGYTFGGYYNTSACNDLQIISNTGAWQGSKTGYTNSDRQWIHEGGTATLYAKWTEDTHTVTVAYKYGETEIKASGSVSGAGIATAQSVTAPDITGYVFTGWSEMPSGVTKASGELTDKTISINATADSKTITANYTVKYALYGSLDTEVAGNEYGMPGWSVATNFTYNSGSNNYTLVLDNLTKPNAVYKFRVLDHDGNTSYGLSAKAVIPESTATSLNSTNADAQLATAGRGRYTLTVVEDGGYPKITISNQPSYLVTLGVKAFRIDGEAEGEFGGTVVATDAAGNTYASTKYIANGETVTVTATPNDGYDFVDWWSTNEYTGEHFAVANPTSWTVTGNVNAFAKFVEKSKEAAAEDGNWSAKVVSSSLTDVVTISSTITVDVDHAKAKRVILDQSGGGKAGKLVITANKGLEVAEGIWVNKGSGPVAPTAEDLVLESSASGNATLIFNNSNSAAATVGMYSIASVVGETWNWQYMASPYVTASALHNYYGSYLYRWGNGEDETTGWFAVPNGGSVVPFVAYCITNKTAGTYYQMDGTMVATDGNDQTISVPAGKSWVVGNSWTAPIQIGQLQDDDFTGLLKNVYLYNTGMDVNGAASMVANPTGDARYAANTYVSIPIHAAPYSGISVVSSLQGFYVKDDPSVDGGGTLKLNYTNHVRPSDGNSIQNGAMHAPKRIMAEDNEPNVLKIKVCGSKYDDRLVLLERADFSMGYDAGWDGDKMGNVAASPRITVEREDGTSDAVSAVPDLEGLAINFRAANTDNQQTLYFEYSDDVDPLYIVDVTNNEYTRVLTGNSYTFSTSDNEEHPRFILTRYGAPQITTGVDEVYKANSARKQMINGTLYIIRDGRIYNAEGALVK